MGSAFFAISRAANDVSSGKGRKEKKRNVSAPSHPYHGAMFGRGRPVTKRARNVAPGLFPHRAGPRGGRDQPDHDGAPRCETPVDSERELRLGAHDAIYRSLLAESVQGAMMQWRIYYNASRPLGDRRLRGGCLGHPKPTNLVRAITKNALRMTKQQRPRKYILGEPSLKRVMRISLANNTCYPIG